MYLMPKKRSEEVWLDPETGLMWQVATGDRKIGWEDVGRYAGQLNYGGNSDWRVPTRFELESLNTVTPCFIKAGLGLDILIKELILYLVDFYHQFFGLFLNHALRFCYAEIFHRSVT